MNDSLIINFGHQDEITAFQANAVRARRSFASLEPESRLLLAVLEDAFDCLVSLNHKSSNANKLRAIQALEWIKSDARDLFSFVTICEIFDFDYEKLRQGILAKAPREIFLTEHRAGRPPRKSRSIVVRAAAEKAPHVHYHPRPNRRCEHYDFRMSRCHRPCSGANDWRCFCCQKCRPRCGKILLDLQTVSE